MTNNPGRVGAGPILAAILLGACAQLIVQYTWLADAVFNRPPGWDEASDLLLALRMREAPSLWRAFLELSRQRAPLAALLPALLPVSAPGVRAGAHLLNLIPLVQFGAAAAYFTLRYGRREQAWIAALMAMTLPPMLYFPLMYTQEFLQAGTICAAFVALDASRGLRRPGWAAAFGALAGIAILFKSMGTVFFAAPVIWIVVGLVRDPAHRSRRIVGLGLAVLAGLIVAGPWYLTNFRDVFGYLFSHGYGRGMEEELSFKPSILSWGNLTFYPWAIGFFGLFGWTLALIAAEPLRWSKSRPPKQTLRPGWSLLVWWIAGVLIPLTLTSNKSGTKYHLAALIPIAVLLLHHLGNRVSRRSLIALLIGIAAVHASLTYGRRPLRMLDERYGIPPGATLKDWRYEHLHRALSGQCPPNAHCRAYLLTGHIYLNAQLLNLLRRMRGDSERIEYVRYKWDEVEAMPPPRFLVEKAGFVGEPHHNRELDAIRTHWRQRAAYAKLEPAAATLPDGSRLQVWVRQEVEEPEEPPRR